MYDGLLAEFFVDILIEIMIDTESDTDTETEARIKVLSESGSRLRESLKLIIYAFPVCIQLGFELRPR